MGSGCILRGNPLTLTAGLSDSHSGGANLIQLDITLATSDQTFTLAGSGVGSSVTISGDLDLGAQGMNQKSEVRRPDSPPTCDSADADILRSSSGMIHPIIRSEAGKGQLGA